MLDPDLDEYISEYRLHVPVEPVSHYADGEMEAEWLIASGFPQLTRDFEQGLEIPTANLKPLLSHLSKTHAKAVKQRVKALNRTIRGRTRSRVPRKPDIRDVFRDVDASSTGTRSRSTTPDSLDSLQRDEKWNNNQIPNLVSNFSNSATTNCEKQNVRRTPSAPLRNSAELFRGTHIKCDIPFYTEGVELLGFQRLGTMHIPRVRSGSDPSCSIGRRAGSQIISAHSHNNLFGHQNEDSSSSLSANSSSNESPSNSPPRNGVNIASSIRRSSPELVSFESMCRETVKTDIIREEINEQCLDVDDIPEAELKKLQPLLWLELAALFDKNHVTLDKRKPFKRQRKEEGNVFGVSINALVRRDQQATGEDTSLVPLLLQGILEELIKRGVREEGILRVAGHKQKIELLYNELELNFYPKPEKVAQLFSRAGVHDLSAILKRWLRELPQPILANDLIHLFYQTHELSPSDQCKALSVLCLILAHENRNTLRSLLNFLKIIISMEDTNKMSKHNVATIIAPSLFPPRFVHPDDKNDISAQVRVAAQCSLLTNVLISQSNKLWKVPTRLLDDCKKMNNAGQVKRQLARKTKSSSNITDIQNNKNHVHRIVI